jgi:hypothetical protein
MLNDAGMVTTGTPVCTVDSGIAITIGMIAVNGVVIMMMITMAVAAIIAAGIN